MRRLRPSPMRHRRAILVLIFAPICVLAQSASMTPVPSNPESKTPRDFSGEPAVIEYSHESMRYEKDGSGTRELRSRIRVQSNAGLSAAGQLVFDYNALNEQLDIRSIRVIRKDGTTVSVGADAVQDLNAPVARSAPMYSDARQKHVTVPGLSVGDSVEYDVVVSERPFVAGHFWHVWAFNAQTISLDDQLELNVPKALALKVKSPPGLAPAVSVERDRQIYRWTTSNFKTSEPIDLFSNFTFDVTKSLEGVRPATSPRVMFSTFQNWAEVADWYAQLERDRRVPTPEIRAKADEITRGLQNDEDKARAIYYWVSQNVRYVALAFGLARYQPHAAAEVLSNRYGDCKDKTTLLEALLEAKGLHPRSALVNLNAEIDPEFPNPAQFDHVIAVLKTSTGDTWMDTTLGVAPFAYLLPQLRGSQALVVSQLPPKTLTKLPPTLPFAPEYALTVDGNVDSAGALDGDVQLQTRGDLSVLIRLVNDHVSPEQLAKIADSILARTNRFLYGSPRYTDFRLINPQDTSEPLKVRFHVTGKPIFVNPKATRAELLQTIGYGVANLLGSLKLLPSAGNQGSSPSAPGSVLSLGGPISYALALNLTFADLASSEVPDPRNFHVSRDFAEFQSKNFWQDQTFHSHTSLQVRAPEIPLTSANDLMAFETSIKDVFPIPSKPSVGTEPPFGSSKAPAPAKYVPSPAVQDLYKRGEDESKRKNWSNAIDAFRSATLADPHYADAWRELGRARMYAHQFSDAEAAFRKYLELSPADHLAYLNMAWVLYNEKKFEEDRDLMLKRLASAPEDGDALFRLGVAYLALRQPAQAVPVLEKSTDRFPRYLAAQMALARAYLETHQDLSAQKSLRRAVAIDGGDGTLNSAAYLLSEHRVSLQTAEEWSHQSIEIVEKELNDSSLASLQAGTWALIMKLSHYWDTMGWIKFQQGQTDAAEKYVLAAYQINDEPIVDFHLGRIYEARDRTREATGAYLSSLRSVPPTGNFEETVKEVRERLAALLGGDAQVDQRLTAFHGEGAPARSTTVANPTGQQGITQYSLIIGPNSRIVDLSPITHDDPLAKLSGELRSTPLPQSFPDNELTKLPRLGTLTCVANDQPCTFALVPGSLASRVAPLD